MTLRPGPRKLCDDGKIDLDLFRYITDSPRIKDVPSLIKNKYCYAKSDKVNKENLVTERAVRYEGDLDPWPCEEQVSSNRKENSYDGRRIT